MNIQSATETMRRVEARSSAFGHAMGLLGFDGATVAPSGSGPLRGETMAVLAEESYKLKTSGEYREALAFLSENLDALDRRTAREVRLLLRDQQRTERIPIEEYAAYNKLISRSDDVWHKAKAASDFSMFQPCLEEVVETLRRFAGYYAPGQDPYSVYLDRYEEGLTREFADGYFDAIRRELVPLIHAVQEAPQPEDSFLKRHYPVEVQRRFTDRLEDLLHIDRAHCSIGETEHPFTTLFSQLDVRFATHYYEDRVDYSLFTVLHEGGHATYELNVAKELDRTCLGHGTSMGIHESQSRFFENMIGRSREFVGVLHPIMLELFPEQLRGVTPEALYRAVNKSAPSLVRTKADELTYSLHVLIRYELEKRLFSGELQVRDVPGEWNRMYREYLGVEVPDDRSGCLQDMHWGNGMFGYFPSYSLGSAYAAQIRAAMGKDLDVPAIISGGDLSPIIAWLRERIYRFGASLTPGEVLLSACGEPFDPSYYTRYLKEKFSALYGL